VLTSDEVVIAVLTALDAAGVPHMLVGSLSTNYYGIPRSSKDADLVIELAGRPVEEVGRLLPPALRLDPQTSFEMVTLTTKNVITHTDSPFQIELFPSRTTSTTRSGSADEC
jgi:hypothetical protein